jgi:tRNA pseudouridine32 synthase / 23S rRNA pseudouridine746 synthase
MSVKEITPDEMLARVLHRDGLMLVVDKPAGLPVHRGPKGGVSLENYFDALRFGLPRAPSLAHRLDKDTSGCLVLGRHRKALAHLGLLFKHGKVGKTYWAVVEGGPEAETGTIDLPLGRLDETRGWWMKPDPKGLPSVTTWKVMGRGASQPPPPGGARSARASGTGGGDSVSVHAVSPCGEGCITWLALTPVTGRTHQLRVHCAASGWPIVGDSIYGTAPRFGETTQQLHAREVVVPISKNKEPVRITAPVPSHMRDWLRACGWNGQEP